jgi:hypothetical protein
MNESKKDEIVVEEEGPETGGRAPGEGRSNQDIEEITINYEEDGILLCKELKKEILSRGAWTTIMFYYQEYDRANQNYKDPKISLRRYQKKDGSYIPRSKFTISSLKQASLIQGKIRDWYALK